MRAQMFQLLARHSGQPLERIERDFDRDRYMSGSEAQQYGLIDEVIDARGTLIDAAALPVAVK
jgi:ATP-dependent Clp protease protease subunit